jgi:organic hydroperoxide reductase OsmC/OhrA
MVEGAGEHTHTYESTLVWTGAGNTGTSDYRSYGRSYCLRTEGKPELLGSAHPDFRGDPARRDPEDLFLAAVSACHMLSYLALCARHGIRVLAYEDHARGVLTLESHGGGSFRQIELRPVIVVSEDSDRALASKLHARAHERCFIANSCSVPITCRPTVRETTAPATGQDPVKA